MREHERNALAVAQFLEGSAQVEKVIYPGLQSHPQHELMKSQAKGFSGMITFYLKGEMANVKKFFGALKVMLHVTDARYKHAVLPPLERTVYSGTSE